MWIKICVVETRDHSRRTLCPDEIRLTYSIRDISRLGND